MNETKVRVKQLEDMLADEAKNKTELVEKTKILESGILYFCFQIKLTVSTSNPFNYLSNILVI